jgi:hypothetical protein
LVGLQKAETMETQSVSYYERLWSKDPAEKSAQMEIDNESAPLLGEALRGNEHVTFLDLSILPGLTEPERCDALVEFVRCSRNLERVRLVGRFGAAAGGVVVDRLLGAASFSPSIEMLEIHDSELSSETLSSLVLRTSSLKDLDFSFCEVQNVDGARGESLEEAFRENKTLESLDLPVDVSDSRSVIHIIRGLRNHSKITELTLSGDDSTMAVEISGAVKQLLDSTTSLEHLFLFEIREFDREGFEPIMLGLRSSHSVAKLSLNTCAFDVEATTLFEELFLTPSKHLNTLSFWEVGFTKPWGELKMESMLAYLLRQNSLVLKNLHCGRHLPPLDFGRFLPALERNSIVESLVLYGLVESQCKVIIQSLPKLRGLRKLELEFESEVPPQCMNDLFVALKMNGSLEEVLLGANFLSSEDYARVKSYCERNKRTHRLLTCPAQVPLYLWPSILEGALQCEDGRDVCWKVLHALPNAMGQGTSARVASLLVTSTQETQLARAAHQSKGTPGLSSWLRGVGVKSFVSSLLALVARKGSPTPASGPLSCTTVGRAMSLSLEERHYSYQADYRALPVEVQALVRSKTSLTSVCTAEGMDSCRLLKILAVLEEQCNTDFSDRDVYVKVIGRVGPVDRGRAVDLAVAVALVSSLRSTPVRSDTFFVGEIDLLGELRSVAGWETRYGSYPRPIIRETGFSRIVGHPDFQDAVMFSGMEWTPCEDLHSAIRAGLVEPSPHKRNRDEGSGEEPARKKRRR